VRCNDWLKFGKLHEYAKQIDAEYVASGHYARIQKPTDSDPWALMRGIDHSKDQSYVLFGAPRERLREMLFPIGSMQKSEVRRLARELDLPVFDKPDSQEICFVPDNDYSGLVKKRTPDMVGAGAIVDTAGNTIGAHEGHQHFTIGQRKGIRIAKGYPLFVVGKDAAANSIIVGEREELRADGCLAREVNWLVDHSDEATKRRSDEGWTSCTAKIRYNAEPVPARVRAVADGDHPRNACATDGSIEVRFDEPQYAVAPGQAVVCYDGDVVICGGWISEAM
jgi:tRNA-specific 2-thiouridylase